MTSDSAELVASLTGEVPIQPSRTVFWGKVGKAAFLVLAVLVAVAVAAALFLVWTVQRSFPQTDGEIPLGGLDAAVTVERDDRGIPTITATTAHDLFYAQGFVHAQDRFWEMDFRRHVTSARVAELFGESQVGTDSFLRTLGWHRIAQEEVELLSDTDRSYYEAYADGVNAYLEDRTGAELSLEYAVLGLQNPDYEPAPWTPADSVAWLKAMAWDLRGNVEAETTRALLASEFGADAAQDALEEIYPGYPFERNPVIVPTISSVPALEPRDEEAATVAGPASAEEATTALSRIEWKEASSVIEAASLLLGDAGEGIGSNSWVVAGSLTETGLPLLANDPHLGASLPSVWHQMQLKCAVVSEACPFNVGGFTFSGLPGVVIGHNAKVAWGFTNLTTDVADLYIEKIEGDSYWYDGELVPLETRTETVSVAGGEDVELTIRSTVHGPIISGLSGDFTAIAEDPYVGSAGAVLSMADAPETPPGEHAVSLRWTALDAGTTASSIFALNTAQDFDDFRYAASLFDVPAQNLIYADTEGNIGYQTPGRLPIRGVGDGWLPQPGWDSAYDWQGFIPFEELPVVYNPASGFIVTANNAIVDDDYEHFLSRDWDYGYRAARIQHLLERRAAAAPLTIADMQQIQADNEMWLGKRLALALGDIESARPEVQDAIELLRGWDAQNNADSDAAAYANVLFARLAQNLFAERDVPLPLTNHGRLYTVIDDLLDDPGNPLWQNPTVGATDLDSLLVLSAEQAYDELVSLQGPNAARWNWGSLHAITLTHGTFGTSGIAPIETLFNRGPYAVGGGASIANATGWEIGGGDYATTTVPSMRMVIDLSDWDASTWNHLTGTSGHAFHEHYTDQTAAWARGEQQPWAFSPGAVTDAAVATLRLVPAE